MGIKKQSAKIAFCGLHLQLNCLIIYDLRTRNYMFWFQISSIMVKIRRILIF